MHLRMVIDMESFAEIWGRIYAEDKKHIRETGWSYFDGPKEDNNESDSKTQTQETR